MSIRDVAVQVSETVTGANGHDMGRDEDRLRARDEIADQLLVDYVYEGLAARGFLPVGHVVERGREDDDKAIVPDELSRAIRQLIASAMMAQCEDEVGIPADDAVTERPEDVSEDGIPF